jgi:hypothetical protein
MKHWRPPELEPITKPEKATRVFIRFRAFRLRSLGLGKYEAVFGEYEIDETVLLRLTDDNLNELGLTALGHRLKLLDGIAALRTDGRHAFSTTGRRNRGFVPKTEHKFSFDYDRAARVGTFSALTRAINR